MAASRAVFLTGATGLLGRYLLRDFLASGRPVTVLARDTLDGRAKERVAELVAFWSDTLSRALPQPVILNGEIGPTGLDLTAADRHRLRDQHPAVVHAAANLSFCSSPDGEPWRTNVAGTASLVRLAQDLGLSQWHQVSTAFVCGRRREVIYEEDLDCGQDFHNPYEQSKFEAERWLRRVAGLPVTVYRPSVMVGDSRTGYTSTYAGIYRFLELAARLADAHTPAGSRPADPCNSRRPFPLRLPVSGAERCDLVPVDWVARAIGDVLDRPRWHGRTFHLVSRSPLPSRLLHAIATDELGLEGVELAGTDGCQEASRLEAMFLEGIRDYRPYLDGAPVFEGTNTASALPHLPAPAVDGPMLRRLIRFAVADRWGRGGRSRPAAFRSSVSWPDCATYLEHIFPRQARQSRLARVARLNLLVAFEVVGPGGGHWSCRWTEGELAYVKRGPEPRAAVTYHTDTDTFAAVVRGRQTPQEAFFEQRITITGDLEMALKLAVLFGEFLRENPCPAAPARETSDACAC